MRSLRFVLLAVVLGLCFGPPALRAQAQSDTPVFISEIHYHPADTNLLAQWIELHNPADSPADLGGWTLTSGARFEFATGTILPPHQWLVVAADRDTFLREHPTVTNFIAGWTGSLRRNDEAVRLANGLGGVVDQVAYATEGDWATRRLAAADGLNRRGWEWYAEHDGLGRTLELVQPALPHTVGQNWAASVVAGGTPGRANSVGTTNSAPLITQVRHLPAIPRSSDPVTITARILDEAPAAVVTLYWRIDGSQNFAALEMRDDGQHGDGLAQDRIYGAIAPPQPDRTVVEFYLTATDAAGHARTYPAALASETGRTANLLYQVDNGTNAGDQPVFRLITTLSESNYLASQVWSSQPFSDAAINGTFVNSDGSLDDGTTTQVRYLCDLRNRGHGTRTAVPHNFHVSFPADQPWKGRSGINLNTHYSYSQHLGSAIFRRAGVPMADSRPVQVRINGANLAKAGPEQFGSYVANEAFDGRLAERQFPSDPDGNLYRGVRDMIPGVPASADLTWHGPYFTGYTNAYAKENHALANDWSDLIDLIDVLQHSSEADYVRRVRERVDVDQWMRYFAANTLIGNQENSLGIGSGDDFGLYRGARDTRFRLLPYDLDSVLGRGTRATTYADGLWRATNVAAIHRFLTHPEFVPSYFRQLKELAETVFAPEQMNPLIDQRLGGYVDLVTRENFKSFNASQRDYVMSLLPLSLTVQSMLPMQSGYARSTQSSVALSGQANAITTDHVTLNGSPATYSAWEGHWSHPTVALRPGLNRIRVEAFDGQNRIVGETFLDVWYDASTSTPVSGTVRGSTTWSAAAGPYLVTGDLTIAAGATLQIEPGTSVYLGSGVSLTVANGGRLLAEGTAEAPIRFTRAPTASTSWGGLVIQGGVGSPETRIRWAHFEFNGTTAIHSSGGTVFLDHLSFGALDHQYLSLDDSSFVVSHCHFPGPTAGFEPIHGTGGVKAGGHGLFMRNYCGLPIGYNDVIDFTGGNRPGQPLIHFLDNVFVGASDDILDLDGTDAWVEGNLFLHTHKNGTPDSSSAISGGSDGTRTSEVTIVNNLFFDVDQALTAKQGNFYTFLNNTVVRQTKTGGLDREAAVFNFADDGTTDGAGLYAEANVIVDAEQLTRNLTPGTATAAATYLTNNLLPVPWAGLGGGNSTNSPLLHHLPTLAETQFRTWEEAQVLRDWLRPLPGSPARPSVVGGRDRGGVQAFGAVLTGVPEGTTFHRTATLSVGFLRTGLGIPAPGFPEGSGYVAYRWRVDGGPWSEVTPIASPLVLTNLADGPHSVEVSGRRDTGLFQDDPVFGELALPTRSATWIVAPPPGPAGNPPVRIDEVLASNKGGFNQDGATPDYVELLNFGSTPIALDDLGLSDNPESPYKFIFPPDSILGPGARLVLLADHRHDLPGIHLGFTLKPSGDSVHLTASPAQGGQELDSVRFGVQVANHSLGRGPDGAWTLGPPTPGAPNVALPLGAPDALRLNEWLAQARFIADHDFVELYNASALPVALGGLWLSDAAGSPARFTIPALSFVAGEGLVRFIADGDPGQGADHLGFKLSSEVGLIRLGTDDGRVLDVVNYDAQRTDLSEGRSPNGATVITTFLHPTPGGSNPGAGSTGNCTPSTETVPLLPLDAVWRYQQTENLDGTAWKTPTFDDTGWPQGRALLAAEDCNCLPAPGLGTALTIGRLTYYFRTHFRVDRDLSGFQLNLRTVLDDGAILWLNGVELTRIGMNAGDQPYANRAARNVSDGSLEFFTLPADLLVPGTNTLAVEVHQTSSSSSDLAWGMGLDATRSTTNCEVLVSTRVALNEVLANRGSVDDPTAAPAFDYVELYNPTTNLVDLAELSLTDDAAFPRKFVFPAGTLLPPGGSSVIALDASAALSATNAGFFLRAEGGSLYLFDRPALGGALVDSLNFGLQAQGFSLSRVPDGSGAWTLGRPTPGTANAVAALASVANVRVNEWMAAPRSGPDWFELRNTASEPVALGGLFLSDDLAVPDLSPIAPLSFIGVGAHGYVRFFADSGGSSTADHVGFSLRASGEALGLFSPNGTLLDGIRFGPQTPGVSQGRLPEGSALIVDFVGSPSPGAANFLLLTNVVINEVLTHTDPPFEDAIELHNPSGQSVDLGGWYLGNGREPLRKYRIPDHTVLAAGGYLVFYENQFNAGSTPFTLNSAHGDQVTLLEADANGNPTGYRAQVEFGAAANGVSWGRLPTRQGFDFAPMETTTFGQDHPASVEEFRRGTGLPNASPRFGPLVLNEIQYHPPLNVAMAAEDPNEEFVEIRNPGAQPVTLYDPAFPTNTWRLRGGIQFEFPPGAVLEAGGYLLVVPFAPDDFAHVAAFRARYSVPLSVPLFGPWEGRLDNSGEEVELVHPDSPQQPPHPDAGFVPRLRVDRVEYSPVAPWPGADGDGNSLQRTDGFSYGNDASIWLASAPTAGRPNSSVVPETDTDGDGLPDAWERTHFGDLRRDGGDDFDGDTVSDRDEFLAGSDPTSAGDFLRFTQVRVADEVCVLAFPAAAGHGYSVLFSDDLGGANWQTLVEVPAQAHSGVVEVRDEFHAARARFYRVVTPKRP